MNTSTTKSTFFQPTTAKILAALAIATVAADFFLMSPAYGQDYDRGRAVQERDHRDDRYQNNRYRNDERDQRDRRERRPVYRHPYRYSQPVYAPPTYYYDRQRPGVSYRSPGLNLFFPLDIR